MLSYLLHRILVRGRSFSPQFCFFITLCPRAKCSGGMWKQKDGERIEVVHGDKNTPSGSRGIGRQAKSEGEYGDEELHQAVVRQRPCFWVLSRSFLGCPERIRDGGRMKGEWNMFVCVCVWTEGLSERVLTHWLRTGRREEFHFYHCRMKSTHLQNVRLSGRETTLFLRLVRKDSWPDPVRF